MGKDLLGAGYAALRKTLRQTGVRSRLRTSARDLGRMLGTGIEQARDAVEHWKAQSGGRRDLPEDRTTRHGPGDVASRPRCVTRAVEKRLTPFGP